MLGVQRQGLGEEVALRREVAVDGACGDARRFCHQHHLSATESHFAYDGASRLQDAVSLVLKLLLDAFGSPVGHVMNPYSVLSEEMNQYSEHVNRPFVSRSIWRGRARGRCCRPEPAKRARRWRPWRAS